MENLDNNFGSANVTENANLFKPASIPAKVSKWTKFRNFMMQDITITMTPKQAKVLQEVHDFWHQEITGKKVHDFLFQEIKIVDNITL